MSYKVRIECGNCYSRNDYEIDRGRTHDDFDLICPNCGCAPNNAAYKVVVNDNMGKYTKGKPKEEAELQNSRKDN